MASFIQVVSSNYLNVAMCFPFFAVAMCFPFFAVIRCMLCICHGVVEHACRYDDLASSLAKDGIIVFAHDHGKKNTSPSSILM